MLYKHILLTTDLSPESRQVAEKAVALAGLLKASLSIAHVVNTLPSLYAFGEVAVPVELNAEHELFEQAGIDFNKEADHLKIDKKQRHLMLGATAHEIIHLVEEKHIDLVLVGAHDKHGLGLLFYSTADEILHALPCDVVAIKV